MTPAGLRRIRREFGLTQYELAEQLGVLRVTVARWETGSRGKASRKKRQHRVV